MAAERIGRRAVSDQRYLPADNDLRGQLDVLQEECAEVIQVCSKIKRFGLFPTDPHTSKRYNNRAALYVEMRDVADAWARVQKLVP